MTYVITDNVSVNQFEYLIKSKTNAFKELWLVLITKCYSSRDWYTLNVEYIYVI